jgi:hypothetical protein|tara:strand:+ start:32 stop:226 length:195 start_codon:yes stop_codon:yes gene_type:complete
MAYDVELAIQMASLIFSESQFTVPESSGFIRVCRRQQQPIARKVKEKRIDWFVAPAIARCSSWT